MITLGFDGFYITLNQDSLTDSRLTSAITQAVRDGLVTPDGYASLVIPAEDNRRAVIEISFAADHDDIDRAKTRAGVTAPPVMAVTPAVITSRLDQARSSQAEAAGVTTFVTPYPRAGRDPSETHLSDSQTPATAGSSNPARPQEPSSIPTPAWPQPVAPRPRFPAGSRLKPPQIPGPSERGASLCPATSGQQRPARSAGAPPNPPASPTRCSPPALRKRTPRQGHPRPGRDKARLKPLPLRKRFC